MTHHDASACSSRSRSRSSTDPLVYEIVKRFDVVPNIRRANVEDHSGWIILELAGEHDACNDAIAYLEAAGCTVNRMEGDVVEG